jgi:hypothetical protein
MNQVRQWAEKWEVDAPCILELALAWCEGGWTEGTTTASYRGPEIPTEWFEQLQKLNSLPVDARWLETGLENIMPDGERRAALGTLNKPRADLPDDTRPEQWRAQRVRNEREDERKRYLRDVLPDQRARLLDRDHALAPLGADPLRESELHFIERARIHFEARVRAGERLGFTVVNPKPKLDEHMDWLIRFQLDGKTRDAIANSSNVVRRAVDQAIHDLAVLLDLRLRTSEHPAR